MTTTERPDLDDPGAHLAAARVTIPGYDVRMGPVGHLRHERARLAGLRWEHLTVRPVGATLGAEIAGVDLTAPLTDEVVAEIDRALADHKVLFFRDQPLTAGQHVAFARRFGALEIHPFIPATTGVPELVRFEKGAEVAGYENAWHHDVTWRACPSRAAVLHAIQVPASGGDTLFSDQCAAYDGLDDDVKERIDDLVAVHDFTQAFGHQVAEEAREEMRATYPPVQHPVAPTHPVTGRRHLFVNRIFTSHVVGLEAGAGRDLIDHLCRQAELPEYQCRFQWTPDAVAFWDNRAVQHYAANDYWPDVRIMEQASIVGDRPAR